jgi:heme-degrading monooxygenase HmoA
MIARIWHGRTRASRADEYLAFLEQRAIPDYQQVAGNRGVYILRRLEGDEAHFEVLTLWESFAAIAEFAGEDISRAKHYPEDNDFLLEFEPQVRHYEAYGEIIVAIGSSEHQPVENAARRVGVHLIRPNRRR